MVSPNYIQIFKSNVCYRFLEFGTHQPVDGLVLCSGEPPQLLVAHPVTAGKVGLEDAADFAVGDVTELVRSESLGLVAAGEGWVVQCVAQCLGFVVFDASSLQFEGDDLVDDARPVGLGVVAQPDIGVLPRAISVIVGYVLESHFQLC